MILHQIQRKTAKSISTDDSLVAMTAYLVANQFIMESPITDFRDNYHKLFYSLRDYEYLNYQLTAFEKGSDEWAELINLSQIQVVREGEEHLFLEKLEDIFEALKRLNIIKAKHKLKQDTFIADNKLQEIIKLIGRKLIITRPVLPYFETGNDEDPYIEYIQSILCETENIPLFSLDLYKYSDTIDLENSNNISEISELPGCITKRLYTFPDISDSTSRSLNLIRENILQKSKAFNKQMVVLRKESLQTDYNSSSLETIKKLLTDNLKGYGELQKIIEEEKFIPGAINSENKRCVSISLVISSMETIIGFYEQNESLKGYVAGVLKSRMDRMDNLMRCCLFYNIYVSENTQMNN